MSFPLSKQRVLLVDDHAIFRSSLAMLLQHKLGFNIVAELDDLEKVKETLRRKEADIVFLDYHLPAGDALTTASQIKALHPHIKVVFLTGTQSAQVLRQLINSTADGVLHKELSIEDLTNLLEHLINGGKAISEQILSKLPPEPSLFSPREFQLFRLLAQGLVTKQAADRMNISTRTAEKHRESLFKKAKVKNLAQLIELGYKWEILDLSAGA